MNSENQSSSDKQQLLSKIAELLFSAKRKLSKDETRLLDLQVCSQAIAAARKNGFRYSEISALLSENGYPVRAAVIANFCRDTLKERKRRRKNATAVSALVRGTTDAMPVQDGEEKLAAPINANESAVGTPKADKSKYPQPVHTPKRPLQPSDRDSANQKSFRKY